jgi:tRNA-specific 2-thiouridylase
MPEFTIGQRKGLPGGSSKPLYVVDIDPESSRVIVGAEEDLVREEFEVDRVNWLTPPDEIPDDVTVKIRYAHQGAPATLEPLERGRVRVRLHSPQRAITPGQAAVFYDADKVVGGGWIVRRPALVPA